jgi:GPI mannosyltransferase 2
LHWEPCRHSTRLTGSFATVLWNRIDDLGVTLGFRASSDGFNGITGSYECKHSVTFAELCRDVGLFRYWTAPNLPLFLLAMPCLWMLLVSSAWACTYPTSSISAAPKNSITVANLDKGSLIRLAMPQVVLALAAFTSYHVQIINRLSSGYPLWYIWLASAIAVPTKQPHDNLIRRGGMAQLIVRSIAIYAIVQGGLFASFLPPA